MRIHCGSAEHFVDAIDQSLGNSVFQTLGFVVHFSPAHAEHFHEKELDQPVPTDDHAREFLACSREAHAKVRLVVDEARFRQRLDHRRRSARNHAQGRRDLPHWNKRIGRARRDLREIDGLQIVLDRLRGQHGDIMYNRRGMDVSDLRRKILHALDAARVEAASKRTETDAAQAAYDKLLQDVAVPLLLQAQSILKAERHAFTVHSPLGSARLVSDTHSETFLELALDTSGDRPQVVTRISVARGAKRVAVEERPLAPGKAIKDLGEQDIAAMLVATIPKLIK